MLFLQKDWIGFQVYSLKISPSNFNFESNISPIHFTRNLSRLRNQFSDPEITNFKFSSRILNSRVSLENASQRNFHLESIESMAHIIWKWNNKSVSFPRTKRPIYPNSLKTKRLATSAFALRKSVTSASPASARLFVILKRNGRTKVPVAAHGAKHTRVACAWITARLLTAFSTALSSTLPSLSLSLSVCTSFLLNFVHPRRWWSQ